ncbi:MAG: YraN family protein [Clostridia bacterium]|nr:YraN family protein [Clostridia bacterium]
MSFSVSRRTLGDMAELRVRLYLIFKGYVILETNYIAPCGEIDIIAKKKKTLVFIEVRSKKDTSARYGTPLETVNGEKQKSIVSAARHYLNCCATDCGSFRFDVVGVTVRKNGASALEHVKDAFYTT